MKGWYLVPASVRRKYESEAVGSGPKYREKMEDFWAQTDEVFGGLRTYYVVLYYGHEDTLRELRSMPDVEVLTEDEVAQAVSHALGREMTFAEVAEMAKVPAGERREQTGDYERRLMET